MYKKTTTTTVEEIVDDQQPSATPSAKGLKNYWNPDVIRLDVPLMIRMMEYAREESPSDVDLHAIVARMVAEIEPGEYFTMEDYTTFVPPAAVTPAV